MFCYRDFQLTTTPNMCPQVTRQPLQPTPLVSSRINKEMLTRPSTYTTSNQWYPPLLPNPPRPVSTKLYQHLQVTHHPVYVPTIIITFTDRFVNLLEQQTKITHIYHQHHWNTCQRQYKNKRTQADIVTSI